MDGVGKDFLGPGVFSVLGQKFLTRREGGVGHRLLAWKVVAKIGTREVRTGRRGEVRRHSSVVERGGTRMGSGV